MSEVKSNSSLIYLRLCLAYFCQFAIWGAWSGALGGYTDGVLGLDPSQVAWLYSAIPLGAIIAPLFIGPIADRYFSAQKVLSVLHFIGGVALVACGWLCATGQQSFALLMALLLLSGICYMPSMSLINSIVFKHLPDASKAPYVFVFGTLGWIVVNLAIAAFAGGAETPNFFFIGGGLGIFLAVYGLTLPDTPPKPVVPGEKSDALGLGALSLFKNTNFAIFVFCAFLASIPACNYFFPSQVPFLSQRGYPSPIALTTTNQISELLFMTALPFFVLRVGLKNVLLLGMGAWIARYLCFSVDSFELAIAGLLLHGLCYSFLYVASYMYADKVAPDNLKASAQSLMVFLLLGVGQTLGGQMYGVVAKMYPPQFDGVQVPATAVVDEEGAPFKAHETVKAPIPTWSTAGGVFQYLDLGAQVDKLMGKTQEAKKTFDLGTELKALDKADLTLETLAAIPDDHMIQEDAGFSYPNPEDPDKPLGGKGTITYPKEDIEKLTREIVAWKAGKTVDSVSDEDVKLTRKDWFAAQARGWTKIFYIPSAFIGVFFLIFLVLGKNPEEAAKKEDEEETPKSEEAENAS